MRPAATTTRQEPTDAVAYAITSGSRCYETFFLSYALSLMVYTHCNSSNCTENLNGTDYCV
jgi:hypothetical protein